MRGSSVVTGPREQAIRSLSTRKGVDGERHRDIIDALHSQSTATETVISASRPNTPKHFGGSLDETALIRNPRAFQWSSLCADSDKLGRLQLASKPPNLPSSSLAEPPIPSPSTYPIPPPIPPTPNLTLPSFFSLPCPVVSCASHIQ